MKRHHWIVIALAALCFVLFTLSAIPMAKDDELEDYIRETITVKFDLQPGEITVDVDEKAVRLDGVVESDQQRREIIETIRPLVGEREVLETFQVQRTVETPSADSRSH